MGMDSYIYKSSKENFEKYTKQKLKVKELHDKATSFINSLHKKYDIKDEWSRELFEEKCTKEEVNLADSYLAEWRDEDDAREVDIFSEEFYWRKPYGLHQFITQKFLNVGEDDNCVHIPLSKENIETIINELKTNPTFFENSGMWDFEDTVDAIKIFTRLLNEYSDDVVITYYSWY
jgi:hypothetical protein